MGEAALEELHIIMQIKSRRMRWAGHVTRMGEESVLFFVGKPEGKSPLGKPRHRGEDEIRMDLKNIGGRCRVNLTGS
jgi:hypothetical protein